MLAIDAMTTRDDRSPVSRTELLAIELAATSEGRARGQARGLILGIVALCDVLEIPLDAERLAVLERLCVPDLEALLDAIRSDRGWPRHSRS